MKVKNINLKSKIANEVMYRKPRFLEVLHRIREAMSREADYDVDLFAEMIRTGAQPEHGPKRNIRGFKKHAPRNDEIEMDETKVKQRRRA
jgi:hypothetical protein